MENTSLDEQILQHKGGIAINSLTKVMQIDEDQENQPRLIKHSPYHEIKTMTNLVSNSKNSFSILTMNIQCIRTKFQELKIFLQRLREKNCTFSAICIQETWLSTHEDLKQYELPDYKLFDQPYSCTSKGGLIIYLHNKFKHGKKINFTESNIWEGLVIEIKKGENLTKPLFLGNIYRPPNNINENFHQFTTEFAPNLENQKKKLP